MSYTIIASMCFPDDPKDHPKCFKALFDHYDKVEGTSGDVLITMVVEDENLIIDVGKGFHCLSISVKDIKTVLKEGC